jgi:8-oxo-dGTP diphosphatase
MRWPERRIGAAAVILDHAGRVLLVHHSYGALDWQLPGGASEPGESIVETAVRELREETGLEGVPESLTGIYWNPDRDAHHFVFRCRCRDDREPVPNSPEISECGYWLAEDPPRPISDFTLRRIQDGLSGESTPLPATVPPPTILMDESG